MAVVGSPRKLDPPGLSPTAMGDWTPERVILSHVLDEHPRRLTLGELAGEVGDGLDETAMVRGVENLVAAHFLFRDGADLVPAPAVVSFDRLAA